MDPVNQLWAGLTAREFKEAVAKQLGVIRNLSKVFLQAVSTEHQAGIGESFAALDVEKGLEARCLGPAICGALLCRSFLQAKACFGGSACEAPWLYCSGLNRIQL